MTFSSSNEHGKDGMGVENEYYVNCTEDCPLCKKGVSIKGYVYEYPEGTYNYDEIKIERQ